MSALPLLPTFSHGNAVILPWLGHYATLWPISHPRIKCEKTLGVKAQAHPALPLWSYLPTHPPA